MKLANLIMSLGLIAISTIYSVAAVWTHDPLYSIKYGVIALCFFAMLSTQETK